MARWLYIEDLPSDARLLSILIEDQYPDIDLDIVQSGGAALGMDNLSRYDAVIVDWVRHDSMDNYELITSLVERCPKLPLIVYTVDPGAVDLEVEAVVSKFDSVQKLYKLVYDTPIELVQRRGEILKKHTKSRRDQIRGLIDQVGGAT